MCGTMTPPQTHPSSHLLNTLKPHLLQLTRIIQLSQLQASSKSARSSASSIITSRYDLIDGCLECIEKAFEGEYGALGQGLKGDVSASMELSSLLTNATRQNHADRSNATVLPHQMAVLIEYPFILLFDRDCSVYEASNGIGKHQGSLSTTAAAAVPLQLLERIVRIWQYVMKYREDLRLVDDKVHAASPAASGSELSSSDNDIPFSGMKYLVLMRNLYKIERYFPGMEAFMKQRSRTMDDSATEEGSKDASQQQQHHHNTTSRDEIQLGLLNLFSQFLQHHSRKSEWVSNSKALAILPEIITRLMTIAEMPSFSRNVRLAALQQLQIILLRIYQHDRIQFIMPGVLSAMLRILQRGDFKTGSRIFQQVFHVFEIIIVCSCSDSNNNASEKGDSSSHTSQEDVLSDTFTFNDLLRIQKEQKQQEGATPIILPFKQLSELERRIDIAFSSEQYHSMTVRGKIAMVQCASSILSQCSLHLRKIACTLLEVLMLASFDSSQESSTELCSLAQNALNKFQSQNPDHHGQTGPIPKSTSPSTKSTASPIVTSQQDTTSSQTQWNLFNNALFFYFEDRFSSIARRLSRIPTMVSENDKKSLFALLNSYLTVFGSKLQPCIQSQFSDISLSILMCLNFVQSEKIQEITYQSNINLKSTNHSGSYMRPKFQFLHDDDTVDSMQKFIRLLGKCGDSKYVINHYRRYIYDCLKASNVKRKKRSLEGAASEARQFSSHNTRELQSIYALNFVLQGAAENFTAEEMHLVGSELLDTLVSDEIWPRLLDPLDKNSSQQLSIHEMHYYVVSSCLLLQTVGTLASILKTNFSEILLIKCLFSVLEKLGDSHGLVQDASLKTLEMLAESLQYDSVASLISQNADYIVDDICYRMQDLNLYPDTPKILGVLLQHTELYSKSRIDASASASDENGSQSKPSSAGSGYESMIGLIGDTLSSVFEGMDNHLNVSGANASVLVIFFSMLRSIARLLVTRCKERKLREAAQQAKYTATDSEELDSEDEDLSSTRTIQDIEAYFRRVHAQKDDQSKAEAEEASQKQQNNPTPGSKYPTMGDPRANEAKHELGLMKDILTRCQHFAQVKDLRVQNEVIDLFLESCEYFIHDSNLDSELLPLMHTLWPSLLRYIVEDTSPVLQEKCLGVIGKLLPRANIGEFLYGRIVDDVWPAIHSKMVGTLNPSEYIRKFKERLPLFEKKTSPVSVTDGEEHKGAHPKQQDHLLDQIFESDFSRLEYKIRRRVLHFLGDILTTPVFRQRLAAVPSPQQIKRPLSTFTIVQIALPYLDDRQPRDLQQAAIDVLCALSHLSAVDALWYYMEEIVGCTEEAKDDETNVFPSFKIQPNLNRFGFKVEKEHYMRNVKIVLDEIDSNSDR